MVCGGPGTACSPACAAAGPRSRQFRVCHAPRPPLLRRYCEDNAGPYNSCSIAQELSDADIDAAAEAEVGMGACGPRLSCPGEALDHGRAGEEGEGEGGGARAGSPLPVLCEDPARLRARESFPRPRRRAGPRELDEARGSRAHSVACVSGGLSARARRPPKSFPSPPHGLDPQDAATPLSPAAGPAKLPLRNPPVWQLVAENIYTHRARRAQEEDDIMICQCKHLWPSDPTPSGCGEACLNRMLNIECVTVSSGFRGLMVGRGREGHG